MTNESEAVASENAVIEARAKKGGEWFEYVTTNPYQPYDTPFFDYGVRNFVMGDVWSRPGLDIRARRFIALSCAVAAGHPVPIQSHINSALRSGDISVDEMREFVLHVAVYAGWAKASTLDSVISETWKRIQDEGGPINNVKPGNAE